MKNVKGFTLIELMIVVAIIGALSMLVMPVLNSYIARVKIAEIKNIAVHIGNEMNTAFMSGDMEGHDYTYDNLLNKYPNVRHKRTTGGCFDGYRAYEISWSDKSEIEKILGMGSKYIKQLTMNMYKKDPSCTVKSDYYQQGIGIAFDAKSFGFHDPMLSTGVYDNNYISMTFSSEQIYFLDTKGNIERVSTNGTPTCGIMHDKAFTINLKEYFTIPISALPSECRYISEWISSEKRRYLFPIF